MFDLTVPTEPIESVRPIPWFTLTCRKCGAVDKVTVEKDSVYESEEGGWVSATVLIKCECGHQTVLL